METKQAFAEYLEKRQNQWKKKKVMDNKMLDYKLNSFAIESSYRLSRNYRSRTRMVTGDID